MNNNFSHLVVNGCSFTYCQGLKRPWREGWPNILAEQLDIPLINLASPGAGNDRIVKTTLEYLYNNPLPNPLYIIAFSHSSRKDEFYKKDNQYRAVSFYNKKRSQLTPYEIGYLENFDALEFSKTKTRLWLSLINTLKVNNISYLATDFIPDTTEEIENLKKSYSYSSLWDAINNDENRITDLEMITRGLTKLPCGHEDYPTMPIIANYIHEEIRKRWH